MDDSWVDARTLHKELGIGKDFTNWIKGRISKYEFAENEDYKLDFPKKGNQNSHGGDRKSEGQNDLLIWQKNYLW